eukprot:4537162-Pyramimonas_sp.AAC.1
MNVVEVGVRRLERDAQLLVLGDVLGEHEDGRGGRGKVWEQLALEDAVEGGPAIRLGRHVRDGRAEVVRRGGVEGVVQRQPRLLPGEGRVHAARDVLAVERVPPGAHLVDEPGEVARDGARDVPAEDHEGGEGQLAAAVAVLPGEARRGGVRAVHVQVRHLGEVAPGRRHVVPGAVVKPGGHRLEGHPRGHLLREDAEGEPGGLLEVHAEDAHELHQRLLAGKDGPDRLEPHLDGEVVLRAQRRDSDEHLVVLAVQEEGGAGEREGGAGERRRGVALLGGHRPLGHAHGARHVRRVGHERVAHEKRKLVVVVEALDGLRVAALVDVGHGHVDHRGGHDAGGGVGGGVRHHRARPLDGLARVHAVLRLEEGAHLGQGGDHHLVDGGGRGEALLHKVGHLRRAHVEQVGVEEHDAHRRGRGR